jgi:hypothetical protein
MDASLTAPNQLKAYRSVDRHGIKELREYYFVARLTLSKQAKQNVVIQDLYSFNLFRLSHKSNISSNLGLPEVRERKYQQVNTLRGKEIIISLHGRMMQDCRRLYWYLNVEAYSLGVSSLLVCFYKKYQNVGKTLGC